MSWGHWNEGHGHGGGAGNNAIWDCMLGYCEWAKKWANGIVDMVYTTFLGIFGWGWGGGWHDHGHH